MASAVIGIQLVTREAVGSGTTRKESSSELSVTLKIHLEVEKTIDRSACAASKRDSSSRSPPIETWAGRGGEIRGAICHPPIVCLSSTTILIPKHELRNPSQILFSSRGGLWRCPSTTVLELISHQESIPAETSISLECGARWATWTEFLRNLWTRERSGIRFSIATLVLFCVSLLTPLFPLESTHAPSHGSPSHPFRAPLI